MIKPDDISYMPSLPGKQRAALKRAYRALQSKRRGKLIQFFWVKKPDGRLDLTVGYGKLVRKWTMIGSVGADPLNNWIRLNTVYRFSIGVSGGYFFNRRPKRYFRLSDL